MLELTCKVLICTKDEWKRMLGGPHGAMKLMQPDLIICDGKLDKFRPINYTAEQIINHDFNEEERKHFEMWRADADARNASKA